MIIIYLHPALKQLKFENIIKLKDNYGCLPKYLRLQLYSLSDSLWSTCSHKRGWSGSAAFKDDSPKLTDQGTRTALPKAPSTVIPPMAQRPSNNPLTDPAPVFRLGEWGAQLWVWIHHMLHFLLGFLIHLLSFRLSLVGLHCREIVIPLPLGFEAQLVSIVFDV